jgi:hypothetical protein
VGPGERLRHRTRGMPHRSLKAVLGQILSV